MFIGILPKNPNAKSQEDNGYGTANKRHVVQHVFV